MFIVVLVLWFIGVFLGVILIASSGLLWVFGFIVVLGVLLSGVVVVCFPY